ncbi:MAG: hypothetical protein GX483_00175 [Actinomycetaceae bacterium]|nr:hypothetical protein [Actinomycetaceae bacterium]
MSFFGINGAEFIVILIVGVIILGPSRTAQAVLWLQATVNKAREWSAQLREETAKLRVENTLVNDANETVQDLNSAFAGIDPTQLDPRKIIKDAVAEEMKLWMEQTQPQSKNMRKDSK